MYHSLEMVSDLWVDLETSPRHRLARLLLRGGTRLSAQVRPYVVEAAGGSVETADLFFGDGTTARGVPFACFCFVDEPPREEGWP